MGCRGGDYSGLLHGGGAAALGGGGALLCRRGVHCGSLHTVRA